MRLKNRNEHHLIAAATGHGKTEFMKLLMLDDLEDDAAVVVLDPKGDLINDLMGARAVCTERTILVDPEHVEAPVTFQLIDFTPEATTHAQRLKDNRNRQLLLNLTASLDADFTRKQQTLFTHLLRLMNVIPGATLETMNAVLEKNSRPQFQQYLDRLEPTDRDYFTQLFYGSRELNETKDHVRRRIADITADPLAREMFLHPHAKLNLRRELDQRSIILVNLNEGFLGDEQSALFARYMIALVLKSLQERADQKRTERKRVYLYLDEASNYLDENVEKMLKQARSLNLAVIVAVQDLDQVPDSLKARLLSNTLIKTVGRVVESDAKKILSTVRLRDYELDRLIEQPTGHFTTFSHHALAYSWTGDRWQYYFAYRSAPEHVLGAFSAATQPSTPTDRQSVLERTTARFSAPPLQEPTPTPKDFDPTTPERTGK